MGEGRFDPWMIPPSVAGRCVSVWGFRALLMGTLAMFWGWSATFTYQNFLHGLSALGLELETLCFSTVGKVSQEDEKNKSGVLRLFNFSMLAVEKRGIYIFTWLRGFKAVGIKISTIFWMWIDSGNQHPSEIMPPPTPPGVTLPRLEASALKFGWCS